MDYLWAGLITSGAVVAFAIVETVSHFQGIPAIYRRCWHLLLLEVFVFAVIGLVCFAAAYLFRNQAHLQYGGQAVGPTTVTGMAVGFALVGRVDFVSKPAMEGRPPPAREKESFAWRLLRTFWSQIYCHLVDSLAGAELEQLLVAGLKHSYRLGELSDRFNVWVNSHPERTEKFSKWATDLRASKVLSEAEQLNTLATAMALRAPETARVLVKRRAMAIVEAQAF